MNISVMKRQARVAAAFLKSLGNEHRLLILCHLAEGERSVGELELKLGLRQAHLSQQLARLRRDGLVKTRRDSRTIYYGLESCEAEQMIRLLYGLFCDSRAKARASAPAARPGANGRSPARRGVRGTSKSGAEPSPATAEEPAQATGR